MSLFTRPYAIDHSARRHVLRALAFGLFVFAFLLVFQPFGLTGSGLDHVVFLLGYGAITAVLMLLLNVLLPMLISGFFTESRWTTGREIAYTTLNIVLIGVANYLYTLAMTSFTGGTVQLLWFIGITFLIGLFPTLTLVLLKERRDRSLYNAASEALSSQLKTGSHSRNEGSEGQLTLQSSNRREDDLRLQKSSVRFLRAADNYVEVYFIEGRDLRRVMIRATLKELAEGLSAHRSFFRCHKSYIVNLDAVQRISGNAQGYKLHLADCSEVIPVSRALNDSIHKRLTEHH